MGEEEVVVGVKKGGSIDDKVEGRSSEGTFHGDGSSFMIVEQSLYGAGGN